MSDAGSVRITVRVTPRAGRDAIDGVVDGALRVRVAAAPADGAANAAVTAVIATALGIPKSRVEIVRGATGRTKVIRLPSASLEPIRSRWPDLVV